MQQRHGKRTARVSGDVRRLVAVAGALVAALSLGAHDAGAGTVGRELINGTDVYAFRSTTDGRVAHGLSGLVFSDFSTHRGAYTEGIPPHCSTQWDPLRRLTYAICNPGVQAVHLFPALGTNTIELQSADVDTVVDAGAYDDHVQGAYYGNNKLFGGDGRDTLHGGGPAYSDEIRGGDDRDLIEGFGGGDRLYGDGGWDEIAGGGESDHIEGGDGSDQLTGDGGLNPPVTTVDGHDRILGGEGMDELHGEGGVDTLDGGPGADTIDGDAGVDLADYQSRTHGVRVSLDGLANDGEPAIGNTLAEGDLVVDVEYISSGSGPDVLTGDGNANHLVSGRGEDTLIGDGGDDVLMGGWEQDTLEGGLGKDQFWGGVGDDEIRSRDGVGEQISCGEGVDRVVADPADSFPIGDCELVDSGPPVVSMSGAPALVSEGAQERGFAVALSSPSSQPVTVSWSTSDGTAVSPGDYAARTASLTIPAWSRSDEITISIVDDALDEPDETFQLTLLAAAGASLGNGTRQVVIEDDDPEPSLSVDDPRALEEGKTSSLLFTVSLDAPSAKWISVDYATQDGSATTGLKTGDYVPNADTLSFAPSETQQIVEVMIRHDSRPEEDETLDLVLTNPANASLGKSLGTGTILDDDFPEVTIDDLVVAEGASGAPATFTVRLSEASGRLITIPYASADGTATAGNDYVAVAGTLSFVPGTTSLPVNVSLLDDGIDEEDEAFDLRLGAPAGALMADDIGIGTVTDDDDPPSLTASSPTLFEGNAGTTQIRFVLSLSAPSAKTVRAQYGTVDGSATAPDDYAAVSDFLTFAPGQTTKTVDISAVGDTVKEGHEVFYLGLSNVINATVASSGLATILNDD